MLLFVFIFSRPRGFDLYWIAWGIARRTDSAMVGPLAGLDISNIKSHFRRKGLFSPPVEEKLGRKSAWYWIIDGNCRRQVIVLPMDTEPS